MKRLFVFCLVLLLLAPAASAAQIEYSYEYKTSDWARKDVEKALDLGIVHSPYYGDFYKPIKRGDFAENAAALVAIEFGSNLKSYLYITNYLGQAESSNHLYLTALDVAKDLGILQGREDGDFDTDSYITRQEAAVMLARTYRAYQDEVPDTLQPLSFADQDDIADWALEDVRLMNHLGIMTGIEDNRFDPLGSYTAEQCFVTLLRLHENAPADGTQQPNPFALTPREEGYAKYWDNSSPLVFAIETEEYYIFSWTPLSGTPGGSSYIIVLIEQDFSRRSYHTAIINGANCLRGERYARPENAFISEEGKLIYTVTLNEDVYYNGSKELGPLIHPKGIYTVTMDLKTGEQTYTRADLD